MSLKAELETWAAALQAYDEKDFEKSLDLFSVSTPFLSAIMDLRLPAHRRFIKDSHKHGSHLCHPRRT